MTNDQPNSHGTLVEGNEMCEEEIDYNVMESFPASDPPSWTLGISPLKKFRSEFDGENLSADQPSHQNERID